MTLTLYAAEPESPTAHALDLLASWTSTTAEIGVTIPQRPLTFEGRFAAQASKEPLDQRSEGSFRSTGVKRFGKDVSEAIQPGSRAAALRRSAEEE